MSSHYVKEPAIAMTDRVGFDDEWKQDAPVPQGWPRSPKTLKESSLLTWQQFLLSSSLVLIPAPFLGTRFKIKIPVIILTSFGQFSQYI
jgi:hypothetical protein